MNLDVTIRATRILRVLVMRWTTWFVGSDTMIDTVARQAQLVDTSEFQQSWIGRSMRCMAGHAAIGLERRMFVSKRSLLVGMALYARRIGAGC